jgi:hypothetical protein
MHRPVRVTSRKDLHAPTINLNSLSGLNATDGHANPIISHVATSKRCGLALSCAMSLPCKRIGDRLQRDDVPRYSHLCRSHRCLSLLLMFLARFFQNACSVAFESTSAKFD